MRLFFSTRVLLLLFFPSYNSHHLTLSLFSFVFPYILSFSYDLFGLFPLSFLIFCSPRVMSVLAFRSFAFLLPMSHSFRFFFIVFIVLVSLVNMDVGMDDA